MLSNEQVKIAEEVLIRKMDEALQEVAEKTGVFCHGVLMAVQVNEDDSVGTVVLIDSNAGDELLSEICIEACQRKIAAKMKHPSEFQPDLERHAKLN